VLKKSLQRRLLTAVSIFAGVVMIGTAGYMLLEGFNFLDALFMTIITVATVGYGETHPLSDTGKIFSIFLIIINVVVVGYSFTLITSFFLEADLVKIYRAKKMNNKISQLQNHVIVCGFGRTGREAATILQRNHIPVVVIEKEENALQELKNVESHLYISMDATTNEALNAAGIRHARALITTLPSDADNVFVTLTASELMPSLLIVSRATNSSSIPKLKRAGAANVIMPYKIGGAHMASLVVNPDVKEFIDLIAGHTGFSAHIEEIDLSDIGNGFIGKTIGEINLHKRTGINIIGLKVGDHYIINPEDSTEYKSGQKLLVLGNHQQFDKLKMVLAGKN
jgi:voltage-gated potassium channel